MPSNGMSSRRTTLKRPIVCKSKPTGNCGACEFDVEVDPTAVPSGGISDLKVQLICDPNPTELQFELKAKGAFQVTENPALFLVNVETHFHLQAPLGIGTYSVKIQALNATKCFFEVDVEMDVF